MNNAGVAAIGARIRAERERRGMSVRALARDVGVSPSLISQIETSKTLPSVSTLYAITTALEVPVDEIFDPAPTAVSAGATAKDVTAISDLARVAGAPPRDHDHKTGPHLCGCRSTAGC